MIKNSMKWLATAMVLTLASSASFALENSIKPTVTEPQAQKMDTGLLVGNSFSYYNCGVNGYLRGFMAGAQPKVNFKLRMTTTSAGALSLHEVDRYLAYHEQDQYANAVDGKLTAPLFDVVILQGHSAAATSDKRLPYFEKYVGIRANQVREAGSTPILVMTWPYKDKPETIKKLADNTIRIANQNNLMVVPVGLAFDEAKKGRNDLSLIVSDKRHPTAAGSYLYGAVLYASLFKRSPIGIDFQGGCEKPLDPKTARYLQEIAWKTVSTFYGWSNK